MEVSLGKTNKIISDESITVQIIIENEKISKDYNLINLLDKMQLNNDENTKKEWSNYICIDEMHQTRLAKIKYQIKFLINIEDNMYLKEIIYVTQKEKKLLLEFIGKDIRTLEDVEISEFFKDRKKYFFVYIYKKSLYIIFYVENYIIKSYYLVPEFYKIHRLCKFLEIMNENIENYEIRVEDYLHKFYVNNEEIAYYCFWNIQNNVLNQRFSENYLYIFADKDVKNIINTGVHSLKIKKIC